MRMLNQDRDGRPARKIGAYVSHSVRALLPDFRAFGVTVTNLDAADRSAIESALVAEADERLVTLEIDTLADYERIKIWREAYRSMGLKAAQYRSSVEQLVRRSSRNGILRTGNWLTDLYNRISIIECSPMGGYDVDSIRGLDVFVRTNEPGDQFEPLGSPSDKFPLSSRTVCYAAGHEILCWALNHRDSVRSALCPASTSATFFSEAVDSAGVHSSRRALALLREVLGGAGAECGEIFEFVALDGQSVEPERPRVAA